MSRSIILGWIAVTPDGAPQQTKTYLVILDVTALPVSVARIANFPCGCAIDRLIVFFHVKGEESYHDSSTASIRR